MLSYIHAAVSLILLPTVCLEIYWDMHYYRLVRHTHARYVATTRQIIMKVVMATLWTTTAIFSLRGGTYLILPIQALLVYLKLWEICALLSDDNWFNTQWKKFKQKLRKLRDIRVRLPQAQPSL